MSAAEPACIKSSLGDKDRLVVMLCQAAQWGLKILHAVQSFKYSADLAIWTAAAAYSIPGKWHCLSCLNDKQLTLSPLTARLLFKRPRRLDKKGTCLVDSWDYGCHLALGHLA